MNGRWNSDLIPLSAAEFRRWRGPNGDLSIWGETVEAKYPDLRRERDAALRDIQTKLKPPTALDEELRSEIARLKTALRNSALQNAKLILDVARLHDEVRELRALRVEPK